MGDFIIHMRFKKGMAIIAVAFVFFILSTFFVFKGFVYDGWTLTPFKERAAWAPGFDPYRFKFEDYQRRDSLYKNLPYILKEGLPMEEVDKILVESGGATKAFVLQEGELSKYWYTYTPWYIRYRFGLNDGFSWNIFVTYNDLKLVKSYTLRAN